MKTKSKITHPKSTMTTINGVLERKGFSTLVDYGNSLYEQITFDEGWNLSKSSPNYFDEMVNESNSYRVMRGLYDLVVRTFVSGYDDTFLSYLWKEYFVEQDVHPDLMMKVSRYYDIETIREKSMIHLRQS